MVGIVVTHRPPLVRPETVAYIDSIVGMDHSIVEGYHHRGDLEGRARLTKVCHSHIRRLPVDTRCSTLEVGDRYHLTRLHFHQDDRPALCLELGELLTEVTLHDALDIHVEGGVDAGTIDGGLTDDVLVLPHIIEEEASSDFPTEEVVVA